jgi:hypothetical protein
MVVNDFPCSPPFNLLSRIDCAGRDAEHRRKRIKKSGFNLLKGNFKSNQIVITFKKIGYITVKIFRVDVRAIF